MQNRTLDFFLPEEFHGIRHRFAHGRIHIVSVTVHQNAFHEVDTYTSPRKQALMLKVILGYYEKANEALTADAPFNKLISLPVREEIGRFKYVPEEDVPTIYESITRDLAEQIGALVEGGLN